MPDNNLGFWDTHLERRVATKVLGREEKDPLAALKRPVKRQIGVA